MKRFGSEKGAALMLAMIVMMILSLLSVSVFTQSTGKARLLDSDTGRRLASLSAEAALDMAILVVKNEGTLVNEVYPKSFGEYLVEVTETDLAPPDADGTVYKRLVVTAEGDPERSARFAGGTATIEAVVKVAWGMIEAPNPLPSDGEPPGGGLGFGGSPDKAKVDVPGHLDDLGMESSVSGEDASGSGDDVLGMSFTSEEAYRQVMEKLSQKILDGKLPADFFAGDQVPYTNSDGDTVTTSIGYVPETAEEAAEREEFIEGVADAVTSAVWAQIFPNANTFISGDNVKITEDQNWGTDTTPLITVIDANKLTIEGGATVTGWGTLLVLGSKVDIKDATLDYNGDIIVIGEDSGRNKSAAELKSKGTLDVEGTITLIGGDATKDKVKFEVRNDKGDEDSYTSVTGAILLLGGGGDEKDKVDFKIKHGSATIEGLILLLGSQIKFDFSPAKGKKDRGDNMFEFLGAIIAGIGETVKGSKMDMKIKGAVSIQYDSVALAQAMSELLRLAGKLGDTNPFELEPGRTVTLESWREIM